jgi:hypothetical protein
MSSIPRNEALNLYSSVSFGGSGSCGGGSCSSVAISGAICGISSHVATSMPAATPQTTLAEGVATGVAAVSCSIAAAPIVNSHYGWGDAATGHATNPNDPANIA